MAKGEGKKMCINLKVLVNSNAFRGFELLSLFKPVRIQPTTRDLAMNARGFSTEVEDLQGPCEQHGKTFLYVKIFRKIEISVNSKLYS